MRYVKMLGLAAMAALASMAFIGTGTASADWLCKLDVGHANECAEGWRVLKDKLIAGLTLAGAKATLLEKGVAKMECDSKALGKFLGQEATPSEHDPVLGLIELLTFTNCEGLCKKAKGHSAPFWLLVEASTLDAWVYGDNNLEPVLLPGALLEECLSPLNVNCLFRTEAHKALLKVEGDFLIADKVPLVRSSTSSPHSGLCPATGEWDAKYLITLDVEGKHEGPIYLSLLP